jgi:hypothetical protein
MSVIRTREKAACALAIFASGIVPCAAFAFLGLHVWAWISLGMIPWGFGCWALSGQLAGSREREICAHLTLQEQEQARAMARAYGRRMAFWSLPLMMLLVSGALLALPEGRVDVLGVLVRNQVQLAGVGLALVGVIVLIGLPAGVKQRRAMRDFLHQSEYARGQGYASTPR